MDTARAVPPSPVALRTVVRKAPAHQEPIISPPFPSGVGNITRTALIALLGGIPDGKYEENTCVPAVLDIYHCGVEQADESHARDHSRHTQFGEHTSHRQCQRYGRGGWRSPISVEGADMISTQETRFQHAYQPKGEAYKLGWGCRTSIAKRMESHWVPQ